MQGFKELAGVLPQASIDELEASIDPASDVAHKLTKHVSEACTAKLAAPLFNALDTNIRGMQADLSACARIASTPMPFAYIVHLVRAC